MHYISNVLLKHARHIEQDAWRGLPELTNSSECEGYTWFCEVVGCVGD